MDDKEAILDALIGVYTSLQWHVQERGGVGMDQKRLDDALVIIKANRPEIFR